MKKRMISPFFTDIFNHLTIQILENGLFDGDRHWFFNDVVSDFNRLYFIIEGKGYLKNKTRQYSLLPGKLYLIPAGAQYTYRCPGFVKKFYLHFQLSLFPGKDLFDGVESVLEMDYPPFLLQKIMNQLSEETLCSLFAFKATLTGILLDFLNLLDPSVYSLWKNTIQGYSRQQVVLSYIERHLSSRLKISEIAQSVHRPYREVSKNFHLDTGIRLKIFIDRMLLQKAKSLLLTSDKTIAEIAEELHFSDAYYFSRFFKKWEKIPPKEYRKKHSQLPKQ